MDVMNQIVDSISKKILESQNNLSLDNHDKLQLIRHQALSASKYIDIFCEKSFPANVFHKLISKSNASDLIDNFEESWTKFVWNCSVSVNELSRPVNFNYRTVEPPLSGGDFDKTILIDHAFKEFGEYFHSTLIYYTTILSLDDSIKKQSLSMIKIRELNSRVSNFLSDNIEKLSMEAFENALSKISQFAETVKLEVGLAKNPYCQYHTRTIVEEHLLRRFNFVSENISPIYFIQNKFTSNSIEFSLRQRPMHRVEVIRDKVLLKKFFSLYKKERYNNDHRYWASSLKRDIVKEIFDFHGFDFLNEESLKEIGIDYEWLSPKYQDLYYKGKGLFNCIDEMIASKNCNIRYLAATAMPYNDPRFKLLIQDRSKKVFLIALEKCSKEHLTFMLTSKKISGNSAKLIIQKRLGA